jgi:excisionase family DNA binding protein
MERIWTQRMMALLKERMETLLLRPEQAAESLSLSRTTVFELLRTGELASVKIGRSRRITPDALRDFVVRQGQATIE